VILQREQAPSALVEGRDVGWVVGHSYIVYGPLPLGATTVLYEGKPVGTPDADAFWRVVAEHGVNALFAAPTAIRREDPDAALPKTRSGKILRKTMRGMAEGADEPAPPTIEDPAVLEALRPVIAPPREP
jgi:acyl-coenzyme A synthetase/AMP-(fatty) acid ligase